MRTEQNIESICQTCGGFNPVWSANNDLFNKVNGSPYGIICPTCFIKKANELGIDMFGIAVPLDTATEEKKVNHVSLTLDHWGKLREEDVVCITMEALAKYDENGNTLMSPQHPTDKFTRQDMEGLLELFFYDFPSNKPLYLDSGLWQLWSDDMGEILEQQTVNESLVDFIFRCKENHFPTH